MDLATMNVLPALPRGLQGLLDLALDLRWSSDPDIVELWPMVDMCAWEKSGNPITVLQSVSQSRLGELASDRSFTRLLRRKLDARAERLDAPGWFSEHHRGSSLTGAAYFCMEFGLGEAFPMYAGGLGILAGDYLKACGDLGVPLTGIGLLYQRGYFRQALSALGSQVEIYPFSDPSQMPILPARDWEGNWANVAMELPQGEVIARVWEARVGRTRVLLLDTNHPLNRPVDRGLAGELYGSGTETRLQQEILLGIGGWRLLRALEMDPQICHINEGHAAFAALERARFHMLDHGIGFRQALLATRPGNLFTTHTPVEAGFDRFPPGLIRQYLGDYVAGLGLDIDEFLALGRVDATASDEPFNMAYLALRICGAANAVSRLHTAVSRGLFASVFPRTPLAEVPVDGVTNAVHVPSWLSPASHRFWLERCGTSCWYGREAVTGCGAAGDGDPSGPAEPAVSHAWKDEDLWSLRCRNRAKLVEAVRNHSAGHHGDPWRSAEERVQPDRLLDPDVLTLGFARRFAGYKRCTLLLRDPDRLARILSDNARPVQLVVAGKAHPSDDEGKAMIRTWAQFMKREDVRQRVSFLVDYDMAVAAQVVQGVDVWVNNPRRPLEASGTSGMKVLANGGLNLSELDGWWDEAYSPDCGWCIGDDLPEGLGGSALDDIEAEQLYRRLERELVPLFYERDACGIPAGWVRMMQNSMERLALEFSADRMVSDYVRRFYLPGAAAFAARTADGSSSAMALLQWMDTVGRLLPGAQVQLVGATDESGRHRFEVRVTANGLEDDFASGRLVVEAYAEPAGILEAASLVHLTLVERDDPDLLFAGEVVSDRPLEHFTPRVRPDHPLAYGRLEMPSLHWLDSLQAE